MCSTKYCRNKARNNRTICSTCDKRAWRKKHPMKAAFQTLRQNTRRRAREQGRPKPFTITFEYFKQFCIETNYMAGKGRTKLSYTVDCVIEELGYVPGNLQRLTKQDNSIKEQVRRRNKTLIYDYRASRAYKGCLILLTVIIWKCFFTSYPL